MYARLSRKQQNPVRPDRLLSQTMPSVPSMLYRFGPRITRISSNLIFNYLVPAIRGLTAVGWHFFRAQVLPRLLAAATALIHPDTPRLQQREPVIFIVPLVLQVTPPPPVVDPPPSLQVDDPESSTPTPQLYPCSDPEGSIIPTYVLPYPVAVGFLLTGQRSLY